MRGETRPQFYASLDAHRGFGSADAEPWRVVDRAGRGEPTRPAGSRDGGDAARSGLRAGVLIGLRLNDLDFEQRLIKVAGVSSKSGQTRDVTMVREVAAALDAYLADERPKPDTEDEPVFVAESGHALSGAGHAALRSAEGPYRDS